MNKYLRGFYKYENKHIEKLINSLVELIHNAPSFNNETLVPVEEPL